MQVLQLSLSVWTFWASWALLVIGVALSPGLWLLAGEAIVSAHTQPPCTSCRAALQPARAIAPPANYMPFWFDSSERTRSAPISLRRARGGAPRERARGARRGGSPPSMRAATAAVRSTAARSACRRTSPHAARAGHASRRRTRSGCGRAREPVALPRPSNCLAVAALEAASTG